MPETTAREATNGHGKVRLPISRGERAAARERHESSHFDTTETRIAVALAEAVLPGGKFLPRADERTVRKLDDMLTHFGPDAPRHYGILLRTLEQAVRPFTRGRAFTALHEYERARLLGEWSDHRDLARRSFVLALTAPLKVAYFDDEAIYQALGAVHKFASKPEQPRYMERVTRADTIEEDIEVECDAVVVGTGAGGAVVAKELAQKGFAVLMLEEGQYHQRHDFVGGLVDSVTRFYRERGTIGSIGNTVVILPMGRMVGGSTAINTGTCWRTPEWVLNKLGRRRAPRSHARGHGTLLRPRLERDARHAVRLEVPRRRRPRRRARLRRPRVLPPPARSQRPRLRRLRHLRRGLPDGRKEEHERVVRSCCASCGRGALHRRSRGVPLARRRPRRRCGRAHRARQEGDRAGAGEHPRVRHAHHAHVPPARAHRPCAAPTSARTYRCTRRRS